MSQVEAHLTEAKDALHALYSLSANTDPEVRTEAIEAIRTVLNQSRKNLEFASQMAAQRFDRGDKVDWKDKDGTIYTAIVEKVNRKTITLSRSPNPETPTESAMARRFPYGVRVPFSMIG